MPNWCECHLSVSGNEKDLKTFKIFGKWGNISEEERQKKDILEGLKEKNLYELKPRVLDENNFIPYPLKFKELDELNRKGLSKKDGFNNGGYEWCLKNWGTKWGICHSKLQEESKRRLLYFFDCAWSPCEPIIKKMSELFPKLLFVLKFYEGGSGFRGIFKCKGNIVLKHEDYDYKGGLGG